MGQDVTYRRHGRLHRPRLYEADGAGRRDDQLLFGRHGPGRHEHRAGHRTAGRACHSPTCSPAPIPSPTSRSAARPRSGNPSTASSCRATSRSPRPTSAARPTVHAHHHRLLAGLLLASTTRRPAARRSPSAAAPSPRPTTLSLDKPVNLQAEGGVVEHQRCEPHLLQHRQRPGRPDQDRHGRTDPVAAPTPIPARRSSRAALAEPPTRPTLSAPASSSARAARCALARTAPAPGHRSR